jgi:hypothetical protein
VFLNVGFEPILMRHTISPVAEADSSRLFRSSEMKAALMSDADENLLNIG